MNKLQISSQKWSAEQQKVLKALYETYNIFENAFQQKDFDLLLKDDQSYKDFLFWYTEVDQMPVRYEGNKNMVEKRIWPQLKNFFVEDIRPIDIQIIENLAMVCLYDYMTAEDMSGVITRGERKAMWIFYKMKGEWIMVGGMSAE